MFDSAAALRLRVARLELRVPLWPSIATLAILPVLVSLGFWQLGRAEFKDELLRLRLEQSRHGPVALATLNEFDGRTRYRTVEVRGQYVPDRQILLDNRTLAGRAGFHVITPMVMADGRGVLVNRGWVPLGRTRQALPQIPAPEGLRVIGGTLDDPPRPGLQLGDGVVVGEGWPMVVLHLDVKAIAQALGTELLPMLVLLAPSEPNGFARRWEPDTAFGPDRHRGYAAQWFALAGALLVIYAIVNLKRVERGLH